MVGGGLKGLTACTELQRKGIPFVLLEKEREIGGHWRDLPGCYHSVYSRRDIEFVDFPFSYHRCGSRHSQFPSSAQIVRYLQDYWTYASICDRTELSTEVTRIEPMREGESDSEWNVYVKGEELPRVYDSVIVSGGHKSERQWPEWAPRELTTERVSERVSENSSEGVRERGSERGRDGVKARVKENGKRERKRLRLVHVKDIRGYVKEKEERVLVVGGGNTACMVASEEASMAMTPISMSFERALHIIPRTVGGIPVTHFAKRWTPPFLLQILLRLVWWINFGDYGQYRIAQPSYPIYQRPVAVNSELLLFIKMGRVIPRAAVASVSASGLVRYEGGEEEEVDTILCATGFKNRHRLVQEHLDFAGDSPKGLICGALSVKYSKLFLLGTHRVPGGEGPVWSAVASLIVSAIQWQRNRNDSASAACALEKLPLVKLFPRPPPACDTTVDPHSYFAELRMASWALQAMAAAHWTP